MTSPVIRRRRRAKVAHELGSGEGWVVALGEVDEMTRDGGTVVVHRPGCPRSGTGSVCECSVVLVGPAVRGVWQ